MSSLKPGDFEVIRSQAGCFDKAIDLTDRRFPTAAKHWQKSRLASPMG